MHKQTKLQPLPPLILNCNNTSKKEQELILEKETKEEIVTKNDENILSQNKRNVRNYKGYGMFKVRYVIYSKKNALHY